jgi:hypothetical protein
MTKARIDTRAKKDSMPFQGKGPPSGPRLGTGRSVDKLHLGRLAFADLKTAGAGRPSFRKEWQMAEVFRGMRVAML